MSEQNAPYASTGGPVPPNYPPDQGATPAGSSSPEQSSGGAEAAKGEAAHLAHEAAAGAHDVKDATTDEVRDVAETTKEQVKNTAAEARYQAHSLYEQARHEVTDQAASQQQRLAGGLRSFSTELESMADGSQEQGLASSVSRQVAGYLGRAGEWLEQREPAQVLDEVSRYARRHPGSFMMIAAGLGVLAGRVARGAKEGTSDAGGQGTAAASSSEERPEAAPGQHAASVSASGASSPPAATPTTNTPGYAPPAGSVDALSTPPGDRR